MPVSDNLHIDNQKNLKNMHFYFIVCLLIKAFIRFGPTPS